MSRAIHLRDKIWGIKLLDAELQMPSPGKPLWSIVDIRFGHLQDWPLELTLARSRNFIKIIFRNVISFRAHDESEILSHWARRDAEKVAIGSIYQIEESAYLDEFATSTAAIMGMELSHYLVAGYDLCVEVLATSPPEIIPNESK